MKKTALVGSCLLLAGCGVQSSTGAVTGDGALRTDCRAAITPVVPQETPTIDGASVLPKPAKTLKDWFNVPKLPKGGFCVVRSFNPMSNDNTYYCELVVTPAGAGGGFFAQCMNNDLEDSDPTKFSALYTGNGYDDGHTHNYVITFHGTYATIKVDSTPLSKLYYAHRD